MLCVRCHCVPLFSVDSFLRAERVCPSQLSPKGMLFSSINWLKSSSIQQRDEEKKKNNRNRTERFLSSDGRAGWSRLQMRLDLVAQEVRVAWPDRGLVERLAFGPCNHRAVDIAIVAAKSRVEEVIIVVKRINHGDSVRTQLLEQSAHLGLGVIQLSGRKISAIQKFARSLLDFEQTEQVAQALQHCLSGSKLGNGHGINERLENDVHAVRTRSLDQIRANSIASLRLAVPTLQLCLIGGVCIRNQRGSTMSECSQLHLRVAQVCSSLCTALVRRLVRVQVREACTSTECACLRCSPRLQQESR
eukprot:m.15655 g.15655  ORF g.15655 m.15655 type:complete len:304 (+) comp26084_c0_seq1:1053-1964(+)